jgi:hypothetical protein
MSDEKHAEYTPDEERRLVRKSAFRPRLQRARLC